MSIQAKFKCSARLKIIISWFVISQVDFVETTNIFLLYILEYNRGKLAARDRNVDERLMILFKSEYSLIEQYYIFGLRDIFMLLSITEKFITD